MSVFARDPFAKTINLPARVVDGELRFFHGGALPVLKDGAICDLIVSTHDLLQPETAGWLQEEYPVEIVPAGQVVLLGVSSEGIPPELRDTTVEVNDKVWVKDYSRFVEVRLEEPLRLLLRGDKNAVLCPCHCRLVSMPTFEAHSLNHAYTRVSEVFEPGRRSRGGNVFRVAYVRAANETWHRLDDIRDRYQCQVERYLCLASLWTTLAPVTCGVSEDWNQVMTEPRPERPGIGLDETVDSLTSYLREHPEEVRRTLADQIPAMRECMTALGRGPSWVSADQWAAEGLARIAELCFMAPAYFGDGAVDELGGLLTRLRDAVASDMVHPDLPPWLAHYLTPLVGELLNRCRPRFTPFNRC